MVEGKGRREGGENGRDKVEKRGREWLREGRRKW